MSEALTLFGEVVNADNFNGKGIIFFLNKTDLFADKLKTSALNAVFPNFKGWYLFMVVVLCCQANFL